MEGECCQMERERKRRIGYLVRRLRGEARRESTGDVGDKRRKRRSTENTGISREMEGEKTLPVSVMIKRFMGVEREGVDSSHSHSSFCLL